MSSTRLTRRLALTLGSVLVINLLVIGLVVALLSPILSGASRAVGFPPLLSWLGAGALLLVAFLVVQLRTARAATLAAVEAVPIADDDYQGLRDRVDRLAQLAGIEPPAVGVVDSDTPNCFSVGGSDPMVVLSDGLLERLDDDELDAVLAHELAHVLNRDATVLTLATFLPTLVSDEPIAGVPRWARSNVVGAVVVVLLVAAVGATSVTNPLVLFVSAAVGLLLGGVLLGVLATPVVYLAHRLAHDREFVADRAGARVVGDPAALASALRKLDDDLESTPTSDLRSTGDMVSELCLLPHGFVGKDDADIVEDEDGFTLRLRSHPPTSERIGRLQALAAEDA